MKKILTVLAACCAAGCISSHKVYDRTVVAYIAETGEPAAGYPVKIKYPYDHYDCIFLRYWNEPEAVQTNLDSHGEVKLPIADFWDPYMEVGSTRLRVHSQTLLHGGKVDPLPYQPDKKYPQVNVEIRK